MGKWAIGAQSEAPGGCRFSISLPISLLFDVGEGLFRVDASKGRRVTVRVTMIIIIVRGGSEQKMRRVVVSRDAHMVVATFFNVDCNLCQCGRGARGRVVCCGLASLTS